MTNKFKLFALGGLLMFLLAGCGESSELKSELENVELSMELPAVNITDCRYLAQADDEVYRQQIAACEMYREAYNLTDGMKYAEIYKDKIKEKNIYHDCYEKRKELNLKIATALNDNVNAMVYCVEDCDNIGAYLKRVINDTRDFYDYYDAYVNADEDIKPACDILTVFYERSNVLAFRFMKENKDDMVNSAVQRIIRNSLATEDLNKYISENNDLIKALNAVYGGVPAEYAEIISTSEIRLVRRMLEETNKLSEDDIDKLMYQLGEPTPEPEATETPEPEETPAPEPEPTSAPTSAPAPTPAPPVITRAPVITQAPAVVPQPPAVTAPPVVITPVPETETPEIYIFE